jgi:hypothetical protein
MEDTVVKKAYRLENILGKEGHTEAWCNCNILSLYSSGNHSGSRPQRFTTRLRVSVFALCNPRKNLGYKLIKTRPLSSISYPIYPSPNMIIKLCLYKHNFIHYLNCIPKAGHLFYALLYNIIPVSFEISNSGNCKFFLFVLVVRLIMVVY